MAGGIEWGGEGGGGTIYVHHHHYPPKQPSYLKLNVQYLRAECEKSLKVLDAYVEQKETEALNEIVDREIKWINNGFWRKLLKKPKLTRETYGYNNLDWYGQYTVDKCYIQHEKIYKTLDNLIALTKEPINDPEEVIYLSSDDFRIIDYCRKLK